MDDTAIHDRELLARLASQDADAALSQVVRRYSNLVYRAARRQVGDPAMAEDVTQAVFLLLSRRAPTLKREVILAGWLIKATRYAAKDALLAERRRHARERKAAEMKREQIRESVHATHAADAMRETFEQIRPLLDEALARLKERDRGLIALRYLEGMTVVELAKRAGESPDVIGKRLGRAMAKLREFFTRRGVEIMPSAVPMVLAQGAAEPGNPATNLWSQGAPSASAQSIARGAARLIGLAKLKAVAAALAIGIVVTASVGATISRLAAPPPLKNGGAANSAIADVPPGKTGKLAIRFTDPSPLSALEVLGRRDATASFGAYGKSGRAYDVASESFQVYVPPGYRVDRADKPFGLFVWISAGDATMPREWQPVFDRLRLIYISADNTGNTREMIPRVGLQLDAVHNMTQRYKIDPDRIYISGFSGGAMTAVDAMRGFPDVFSGVFAMSGGAFYIGGEDADANVFPSVTWLGTNLPIEQAAKVFRVVLLHGTNDYYAIGMKSDYESMVLDDFSHVTHLMIDGMGHQMPGAALFEKGLSALDKSKPAEHVPVVVTPRPATIPTSRPAMTYRDVKRPLPAHDPDKQAARVLVSAASYLNNGWPEGAAIGAQRILTDYPQTPAAAQAKVLLDRVNYIKPVTLPHANLNTATKQALFQGRIAMNRNTFDAARLYFERIVTLKPESREAKEAQAWVKWMDDHPGEARPKPLSAAVLGTILFQSGMAYEQDNKPDLALAAYQRTIQKYPGTPAADAARKMLAKLRSPMG